MTEIFSEIKQELGLNSPPGTSTPTTKPKIPKRRAAQVNGDATPTPKKSKGSRDGAAAIPGSVGQLGVADKNMIRLREEGKPWLDIAKELEKITGNKYNHGSIAARYSRLKAALARVNPNHLGHRKELHAQVQIEIEAEVKALQSKLWSKITEKMNTQSEEKYANTTVEKEWKNLEKDGAVTIAADTAVED